MIILKLDMQQLCKLIIPLRDSNQIDYVCLQQIEPALQPIV